ncbi:MAG: hypothetical protein RLZZ293_1031 [Pseudomonadota bacterium]|jgi:tRNA pseudouridine55 synthase
MNKSIDGVLLLDKPLGLSSNQAIQKVKRILKIAKVGHTGTLDPLATGLLPICLGQATKFASFLLDGDKEYIATAQLGIVTDSGDSEGNLVATNPVATNLGQIEQALVKFEGLITQTPPMYSALKYQGRPLYEYAREGIIIERPSRQVTIKQLELLAYNPQLEQITFRSAVSKGTYIRTLAEDIGSYLGCGASLIALRRTKTNQFDLTQAYSLEQLTNLSNEQINIFAPDLLVSELAPFELNQQQFAVLQYGNLVAMTNLPANYQLEQLLRLYYAGQFLGVGYFALAKGQLVLHPKRLLSNLRNDEN